MDEDFDARLELVVASSVHVVDAQDRLGIGEQILFRQEVADLLAEHRGAAHAAADIDGKAQLARLVPPHVIADVVELDRRPIDRRAGHRDLEFARQEQEFRVQRRPLPQDLRIGPRVGDFVGRHAGEMVGGDVADAVARSLDAVHLDLGQFVQDIRHVLQLAAS